MYLPFLVFMTLFPAEELMVILGKKKKTPILVLFSLLSCSEYDTPLKAAALWNSSPSYCLNKRRYRELNMLYICYKDLQQNYTAGSLCLCRHSKDCLALMMCLVFVYATSVKENYFVAECWWPFFRWSSFRLRTGGRLSPSLIVVNDSNITENSFFQCPVHI